VPIVLKSESLNLLEPSGPVKAYNGIALLARDVQENSRPWNVLYPVSKRRVKEQSHGNQVSMQVATLPPEPTCSARTRSNVTTQCGLCHIVKPKHSFPADGNSHPSGHVLGHICTVCWLQGDKCHSCLKRRLCQEANVPDSNCLTE
jgi:hypothetical protein